MENVSRSICRSCRTRLARRTAPTSTRAFTSTSTAHSIPPESPHFLDVPEPFQPTFIRQRPKKGFLPTPRDIFPRNKPEKATSTWITTLTPPRKSDASPTPSNLSTIQRYKLRMADLRKSHLRSSLVELHQRKTSIQQSMQKRSQYKSDQSQRLVHQPPRHDERLTNNSIPSTLLAPQHNLTPTEALAIHDRKTANVAAHEAKRVAERVDALHTLYMNARHFITDEKQMLAKIKAEFEDKSFGLSGSKGQSYWDSGPPDDIKRMVDSQYVAPRKTEPSGAGLGNTNSKSTRDQERMKRIAEKLSGGKL